MQSREHKPYHERSLDQQVLDALLRIEELLTPPKPEPVAKEAVKDPDGHTVGCVAKEEERPRGKRNR